MQPVDPQTVDWSLIWTVIGTGAGVIGTGAAVFGFIYTFLRNFKSDIGQKFDAMEKRLDQQDERIFLLATGKTLREAMIESKKKSESQ